MNVVYVGPASEGVIIAETGQHAEHGKPIEVSATLGRSLLEQDIWQAVEDAKAKPLAKEQE